MFLARFSRMTTVWTACAVLAGVITTAPAAIWLGSQNCFRLGQNHPSGASQSNKKAQLKTNFAANNMNLLQEVMVTSEVANVAPSGYYTKVSGLKGTSSYSEAYGFVYNATISGGIVDYSSSSFSRPPSGLLTWSGSGYFWAVNYHAAFDATPNATEIQLLNNVYTYYKGRSGVNSVIIGGDFNRTATSSYFNNLKNAGCSSISPNVATSLNASGAYASPYDHFAWNPSLTSISGAYREENEPVYWRNNVSDHVGIYARVIY